MATLLPKSNTTPNLSIFVASSLVLSALSVVAEGFCCSLCFRDGVPGLFTLAIVCRGLGTLLYPGEWLALCKQWWDAKNRRRRVNSIALTPSITIRVPASQVNFLFTLYLKRITYSNGNAVLVNPWILIKVGIYPYLRPQYVVFVFDTALFYCSSSEASGL